MTKNNWIESKWTYIHTCKWSLLLYQWFKTCIIHRQLLIQIPIETRHLKLQTAKRQMDGCLCGRKRFFYTDATWCYMTMLLSSSFARAQYLCKEIPKMYEQQINEIWPAKSEVFKTGSPLFTALIQSTQSDEARKLEVLENSRKLTESFKRWKLQLENCGAFQLHVSQHAN